MKDPLNVAAVQFEHIPGNKRKNLKKIKSFVKEAARQNVEMIVFPECCITGYWHLRHLSRDQLTALAEPVFDGPSSQVLSSLSRKYGMTIGAGLIEKKADNMLYNTYVVAMPDGTCQRHRKLHTFISKHMAERKSCEESTGGTGKYPPLMRGLCPILPSANLRPEFHAASEESMR